jgi:cytochrome c oxidase cbb3-type subunit 3
VRRALGGLLALGALAACGRSGGTPAKPAAATAAPTGYQYGQHVPAGGKEPVGVALDNPYAGDSSSAAAGAKLFTSMNCDGCHGVGATGSWAPALNDQRWRYGGADGAIYQSIYYGRPQGMPAFGGILEPAIVWKLVTYLKSLPPPKAEPTQSW